DDRTRLPAALARPPPPIPNARAPTLLMTASRRCRPLRVCVCAPYDLGRDGGVNSHIRAQARALRALGHHVCVFGSSSGSLHDGERALSGCIFPVGCGTETGFGIAPLSWWRVAPLLKTARFDLIHMHEPLMPL